MGCTKLLGHEVKATLEPHDWGSEWRQRMFNELMMTLSSAPSFLVTVSYDEPKFKVIYTAPPSPDH
jgi:hypothetical protein